jgi:hypothetical protein
MLFLCVFSNLSQTSLRLIAPVMLNHGIVYEREKFQTRLENGTCTLDRTKVVMHC